MLRIFSTALAVLIFLAGMPAVNAQLNVLLITADDLGVQLGCYGDTAAQTENLDALARRGVLFENAYVAQASCSPSRSAMFTGLYPHFNGQYGLLNAGVGFQLHADIQPQTIPNLLKRAGYRTGIIGKLHVGQEAEFNFDTRLRVDTRDVKKVAEEAEGFFRQSTEPFFLMANYSDPHVYGRSPRPPQEAFPTQYLGVPAKPIPLGQVPTFPFHRLNIPEEIERTTQYYNAAKRFDEGVGLLLKALESCGETDTTLVLFVGDHGPPFFRGKTSCYEAGVHVPMLMVWPGLTSVNPATRSPALVSTVDLLPTIMDACGIKESIRSHGNSLRFAAAENSSNRGAFREYLATEFHYHGSKPFFPRRSIRDFQFKLIHNLRAGEILPNQGIDGDMALPLAREAADLPIEVKEAFERAANPPEYELYDLQKDPWEFHNLAGEAGHAATLAKLKQALLDWRQKTEDPLLTEEGYRMVAEYESRQPQE